VAPDRTVVLLTDTVGFIRKLPHHLVASFHSTLVEAIEADLLLHVVDASDALLERRMAAVELVLEGILTEPRPTTLVFNKADLIDDDVAAGLRVEFPGSFVVSARTGEGMDSLRSHLWEQASLRLTNRQSGDQPRSR
jgi:GTP-binding protein HflX